MPDLTGFALSVGKSPSEEASAWPLADSAPPRSIAGTAGSLGFTAAVRSGGERGVVGEGGRTVLLAGELYGRARLLEVLGGPASSGLSDAEIVSELFAQYGTATPALLNGRFAGAVIEPAGILLFTDHAGTVPLYFAPADGGIVAATEAKALVRGAGLGGVRSLADLDLDSALDATPFDGISRVPNGAWVAFRADGTPRQMERHFDFPRHRSAPPARAGQELLLGLLRAAVSERLGPRSRVATVLSGGVDSSTVTALAVEAGAEVHTFTLGTPVADEFAEARLVAEALGTVHHEVEVADEELIAALPHAVWAAEVGDPRFVEYLLPLHCVLAEVAGEADRVITGYGADIVLGGMLDPASPSAAREEAIAADLASTEGSNEFTPLVGTRHGVWTTHPFWDREVLSFLSAVPAAIKGADGIEKHVLRAAVADLLPEQAVWRPKLGIHQSTGLTRAFDRLLAEEGAEENLAAAKQGVVHRLLKLLYEDGVTPDEIDIAEVIGTAVA